MCGIIGGVSCRNISEETIQKMLESLSHRGPDAKGIIHISNTGTFLGHHRLSVIDLSSRANQPMTIVADGGAKISISYNGEIYNYKEIRKELENIGHTFNTSSDTEVVLRSFVQWGKRMTERFRGMFSFALWDGRQNKMYLVRDRFGVKPLYYFKDSSGYFFASEMKALYKVPNLKKDINKKVLAFYLRFGFVPEPFSIIKGVEKVKPGEIITISENGNLEKERYWNPRDLFTGSKEISDDKAEEDVLKLLKESFSYRMIADVEVGIFLSGGIDSSLVTALLQEEFSRPLKTFTIGFRETRETEEKYAEQVAKILGTKHHTIYANPSSIVSLLPEIGRVFDEPFGDSSSLPFYLLSKQVSKEVKVVLSGDGGDELFYGYNKYLAIQKISSFSSLVRKVSGKGLSILGKKRVAFLYKKLSSKGISNIHTKIEKAEKLLKADGDLREMFSAAGSYLERADVIDLTGEEDISVLSPRDSALSPEEQMRLWDIEQYLVGDILMKTDRTTMAVGLEAREPFLDPLLLSFAARLPRRFLFNKGSQKCLLKKILLRYLPKNLVERPKMGFRPPVEQWLSKELRNHVQTLLNPLFIHNQGIFNESSIAQIRKSFEQKKQISFDFLWILIMFQIWYKTWIED